MKSEIRFARLRFPCFAVAKIIKPSEWSFGTWSVTASVSKADGLRLVSSLVRHQHETAQIRFTHRSKPMRGKAWIVQVDPYVNPRRTIVELTGEGMPRGARP